MKAHNIGIANSEGLALGQIKMCQHETPSSINFGAKRSLRSGCMLVYLFCILLCQFLYISLCFGQTQGLQISLLYVWNFAKCLAWE
jgi:hypothetical protein